MKEDIYITVKRTDDAGRETEGRVRIAGEALDDCSAPREMLWHLTGDMRDKVKAMAEEPR
jgi:hypothetical protein